MHRTSLTSWGDAIYSVNTCSIKWKHVAFFYEKVVAVLHTVPIAVGWCSLGQGTDNGNTIKVSESSVSNWSCCLSKESHTTLQTWSSECGCVFVAVYRVPGKVPTRARFESSQLHNERLFYYFVSVCYFVSHDGGSSFLVLSPSTFKVKTILIIIV